MFAGSVPLRSTELDRSFDILEHTVRFIYRDAISPCSSVHELLIQMAIVADCDLWIFTTDLSIPEITFLQNRFARNQPRDERVESQNWNAC